MLNYFSSYTIKMVRKSTKQIIKQSVNVRVHVGDSKKKKNGRRRKRGGGSGGGSSMPQQLYNPVYIQSGTPSESDNPLHRAIRDLNDKVDRQHIEHKVNPLLSMVANEGKGHTAENKATPLKSLPKMPDKISDHYPERQYSFFNNPMPLAARAVSDSPSTPQMGSPPLTARIRIPKVADKWHVGDPVPTYAGRGAKSLLLRSYEAQNTGKSNR